MQTQTIESGVQLFSRINQRTSSLNGINPKLFRNGGPNSNEIIEIAGDFSLDLILDFLMRCILPKELNPEWKDTGVVFVNTNHKINILKIATVMDSLLKHLNVDSRKTIIEKALTHITILNCYDSQQMQMTFRNLEKTIQNQTNINLLVVDDVTTHYWIAKQTNFKLSLDNYAKANLQILQTAVKNLNLVLVFSRYQVGDLRKTVDLHVDYKIIGEKVGSEQKYTVMDYSQKSSITVLFKLDKFITFT